VRHRAMAFRTLTCDQCSQRQLLYRTMLMTLYSTGMRVGELVRLKAGDIDSHRMLVHIREGKGKRDRLHPTPVLAQGVEQFGAERHAAMRTPWNSSPATTPDTPANRAAGDSCAERVPNFLSNVLKRFGAVCHFCTKTAKLLGADLRQRKT
jgi:integrase